MVPSRGAARDVVQQATALLHRLADELRPDLLRWSGTTATEMKGDGTPVTVADVEVNERIEAAIEREFPDHIVLSEELATDFPGADWAWIVDPIDGTSNFTTGVPYWCVSIALALEGEPILGFVDAPPVGARYLGVAGEGATKNGEPLEVRPAVDVDDPANRHIPLLLSTVTARRARPRVRLNPRVLGSAALDLCLVAEGAAAAALSMHPRVWDHAAGSVIVAEAGGVYATLDGEPLLPLRPGTEYATLSATAGAGPDRDYLELLVSRLMVTGEDLARH